MKRGLLDYLVDHPSDNAVGHEDETSTFDEIGADDVSDEVEQADHIFITAVCSSYIESYESGELTFDKSVRLTWTFLDEYEGINGDSDALCKFKSEILYEALEHLVTSKPAKGVTRRTPIGTPPPRFRKRIRFLVDGLIERNKNLKKLPLDIEETEVVEDENLNNNVFIVAAERFQKWGFPKTTAKMVRDCYYPTAD